MSVRTQECYRSAIVEQNQEYTEHDCDIVHSAKSGSHLVNHGDLADVSDVQERLLKADVVYLIARTNTSDMMNTAGSSCICWGWARVSVQVVLLCSHVRHHLMMHLCLT